ncbi:hypothetical protein BX666DRAFT_1879147 [Dichotomocladium elegans]|nr:hypothetical protein BX666DRAFT_1879147 [Dichotomocladium elegans]
MEGKWSDLGVRDTGPLRSFMRSVGGMLELHAVVGTKTPEHYGVSPSSLSTASEHSDFGTDDESESDEDTAETLEEDDDDGQEVKEARVNRKIADLEISNQSLLAVNEMLEITVRRQATQVAQLRKQLGVKGPLDIKPLHLPLDNQNDDDESDTNWENDTLFSRMKQLTESMIQQGEASLRSKYKERVLSSYLTGTTWNNINKSRS